jgi:HTH-type transcriptional regulator/antitoxin HigA
MNVFIRPALLDFTHPHTLRNPEEYGRAVAELDGLVDLDPAEGTREYDRLEFLSLLTEAYETARYPMGEAVTPQRIVDFFLEQHSQTRADLATLFGGRSRVSDFFKGKRRLSLSQISRLGERLGIPADLLIERPRLSDSMRGSKVAHEPKRSAVGKKKRAAGR